jgi:hypothetical protein
MESLNRATFDPLQTQDTRNNTAELIIMPNFLVSLPVG